MALTDADYTEQLQALLPPGAAWSRDPQATLTQLLSALAAECARLDARAERVLVEADPRTTYELLGDWERVAGLPDACAGAGADIDERRLALVQRITMLGGSSRAYFVALADALGYAAATITEFLPMTCVSACADALNPPPGWPHAWRLNLASTRILDMSCVASCESSLRAWGDATLECVVRRLKPAHTQVLFSYGA